jgi:thiamine pyrophosphate-dependent acetolactate synthase large subunit-like protein
MQKTTASDILIDTLADWGVSVIFGLPGDGINGIMEALRKRKDRIRFVQDRHEESAAFMACAYAKYTGKLGVCLATSGPGGIHLLNGLYDAKGDGQPVLAITGMHYHDLIHRADSPIMPTSGTEPLCGGARGELGFGIIRGSPEMPAVGRRAGTVLV